MLIHTKHLDRATVNSVGLAEIRFDTVANLGKASFMQAASDRQAKENTAWKAKLDTMASTEEPWLRQAS